MNFLAHLHLAAPTPASWIGNLLPDFVRGRLDDDLHPDVAAGVRTHRLVDAFTDTHPIVAQSKSRLRARHGLFSGVLVDIFYDHFLTRNWRTYHHQPVKTFIEAVYTGFAEQHDLMPPAMRPMAKRLQKHGWLLAYGDMPGLEDVLTRMSERFASRFNRTIHLQRGIADLQHHYQELEADFHRFYPELVSYVQRKSEERTLTSLTPS